MTRFKWELSKPPDAKELEVTSPGLFMIHMERAFGAMPIELTEKDLPVLQGMAATWTDISVSPYVHLIQAVKRFKAIRVWVEYSDEKTTNTEIRTSDHS